MPSKIRNLTQLERSARGASSGDVEQWEKDIYTDCPATYVSTQHCYRPIPLLSRSRVNFRALLVFHNSRIFKNKTFLTSIVRGKVSNL